jgi:hypothetical protein
MADLKIKAGAGSTNKLLIQSQDQTGSNYAIQVGDAGATTLTNATLTTATLTNATITAGTFPAGHILQVVTKEDLFDFSGATRNNTGWGDIETFTNAITVQKGNKVLFLIQGCKYYTTGTTGHNGNIRAYATDGTNSAAGNSGIQQNQNFSLPSNRLWGATSSGILTTASGSGTVGVTFSIQGKTDASGTINYGDTNDDNNGAFILWEVQA